MLRTPPAGVGVEIFGFGVAHGDGPTVTGLSSPASLLLAALHDIPEMPMTTISPMTALATLALTAKPPIPFTSWMIPPPFIPEIAIPLLPFHPQLQPQPPATTAGAPVTTAHTGVASAQNWSTPPATAHSAPAVPAVVPAVHIESGWTVCVRAACISSPVRGMRI